MINDSLWLDEATTALVSRMSWTDILTKFIPNDFHPPLYYFLMKIWVGLFGSSEISLRLPSVIFALLTVYIVYKMAGKIAASLLITAPLFFYYSQEARMYTMVTFIVTALFYLYQNKKWFLFAIGLAVLGLTDYVALFVVPVFFLIIKDKKIAVATLSVLLLSYMWWIKYFLIQFKNGLSVASSPWGELLGTASIKNFALIPAKFILGRISFDNKHLYFAVLFSAITIFGYLLYLARKDLKVYWYWLTIPIVIGLLVSIKIPALTYFRFLFCLPAFYILIAAGIDKLKRYKKIIFCLVIIINLLSLSYYLATPRFHHEDWRRAALTIDQDQIITPTEGQREALIYYGLGQQIVKTPTAKNIWLSRYVWEVFDPKDSTRLNLENMGYNKISEYNFNGVTFFKYESSN